MATPFSNLYFSYKYKAVLDQDKMLLQRRSICNGFFITEQNKRNDKSKRICRRHRTFGSLLNYQINREEDLRWKTNLILNGNWNQRTNSCSSRRIQTTRSTWKKQSWTKEFGVWEIHQTKRIVCWLWTEYFKDKLNVVTTRVISNTALRKYDRRTVHNFSRQNSVKKRIRKQCLYWKLSKTYFKALISKRLRLNHQKTLWSREKNYWGISTSCGV